MAATVRILMACVIVSFLAPAGYAQQPEPYLAIGTWKLNPAKSKGTSNQLKARSRIHTVEDKGGGVTVNRIEQIEPDGSRNVSYFTVKADGSPYPMIGVRGDGSVQVATMTETRVDTHTIRWAIRNDKGDVTAQGVRTIAKDGRSFTLGDLVYDRQ